MNILIVDDDPGVARALARFLSALGWQVWTAGDDRTALQILGEQSDIAVVVVEVGLREVNGEELVCLMRQRHPNLAIIVMTSRPDLFPEARASEMGVSGCLVKPFDGHTLAAAATAALQSRQR